MNISDRIIKAAFESDENLQNVLHRAIREDLNMNTIDFSKEAGIPQIGRAHV